MAISKADIEKIVGKSSVLGDRESLKSYAGDQSFVKKCMPDMVAFVETVSQIQGIVKLANQHKTPIIPYSSGQNLHGATIPDQGGIVLNMSGMKKILFIDEENWSVMVEPGVTYRELQQALSERGFRVMIPFGVPPGRSVLTSYLERDTALAAPSFECGNALVMDMEMVLPGGEVFRTGNWAVGGNPGTPNGPVRSMLFRLWTGAQGTLGVVTKMNIGIDLVPPQRKMYFIPMKSLAEAAEVTARIQRREIGMECLVLNRFNLAVIFENEWGVPGSFPTKPAASDDFEQCRNKMPEWLIAVCLNGLPRHPEEKLAYESEALKEVCSMMNVELLEDLPGVQRSSETMLNEMLYPWSILKKFNYRGSVQDLTFKAPLDALPALAQRAAMLAEGYGYPLNDIGIYALPLERGRGAHCEIDLHCNRLDDEETDRIRALWLEASAELVKAGAYFDRPYGAWAGLVYSRAAVYTHKLKQIKAELDPNNIMNPGKLCFQ